MWNFGAGRGSERATRRPTQDQDRAMITSSPGLAGITWREEEREDVRPLTHRG